MAEITNITHQLNGCHQLGRIKGEISRLLRMGKPGPTIVAAFVTDARSRYLDDGELMV
jgi:hypothetical protein